MTELLLSGENMALWMRQRRRRAKPTIEELESLLDDEEDTPIEILPNGEIRALGGSDAAGRDFKKPLTMRENLGGEYRA